MTGNLICVSGPPPHFFPLAARLVICCTSRHRHKVATLKSMTRETQIRPILNICPKKHECSTMKRVVLNETVAWMTSPGSKKTRIVAFEWRRGRTEVSVRTCKGGQARRSHVTASSSLVSSSFSLSLLSSSLSFLNSSGDGSLVASVWAFCSSSTAPRRKEEGGGYFCTATFRWPTANSKV